MKPGDPAEAGEDKTLRTGKGKGRKVFPPENPPLATVNTHLSRRHERPEYPGPGVPIVPRKAGLGHGKPWTKGDGGPAGRGIRESS
jgi:hypothetical protein